MDPVATAPITEREPPARGGRADGDLPARLAAWRRELAGAPAVLELPADRPRPAVRSGATLAVPVALSREATGGLRRLAPSQQAPAVAAFAALLHRLTHQDELVIALATEAGALFLPVRFPSAPLPFATLVAEIGRTLERAAAIGAVPIDADEELAPSAEVRLALGDGADAGGELALSLADDGRALAGSLACAADRFDR